MLRKLCLAPRAFDRSVGHGLDPASPALRHFAGPPRWTLIEAACARVPEFRDLVNGAWMALPRAFRTVPCPEIGPYLRAAFPDGWPDATVVATAGQRHLAHNVAERNELWQADDGIRTRVLRSLGLPVDRAAWRGLRRPVAEYSASEIFVLEGLLSIRVRPAMYLGVDRTDPELLRQLFENLLDAHAQAAADGEIGGHHLTVESDARVTLAVDGAALAAESRPMNHPSELTSMFTAGHWCRTEAAEVLNRMAAFCSGVSARTWYGGQGYAQEFADLAPVGPVRPTGPAEGTGYRVMLELDTDWLPPGAAVPRGLDSRPHVTDLRPPA